METPTAVAAGAVLTFFGGALLLWCAVELRLRHHLRRHGVQAVARVVADGDPYGDLHGDLYGEFHGDTYGELDSAPLLAYSTVPASGSSHLGVVQSVLARPRGTTPLRRPARPAPGAVVRIAYDARRPSRVVLAAGESGSGLPSDIFWALLGTSALAGGLSLLGAALAG